MVVISAIMFPLFSFPPFSRKEEMTATLYDTPAPWAKPCATNPHGLWANCTTGNQVVPLIVPLSGTTAAAQAGIIPLRASKTWFIGTLQFGLMPPAQPERLRRWVTAAPALAGSLKPPANHPAHRPSRSVAVDS